MFICDDIKIPELVVSNKIENIQDNWFFTKEKFNHMDAVDITTFTVLRSFRLEKFLRRLHFKGTYSDYVQLNSNNFTQLEQLKIDIAEYSCTDEDIFKINIQLPHLEVLEIEQYCSGLYEFHLTTPNLKMLKCDDFEYICLTHLDTINHLETILYHENIQSLKNIQYFKVVSSFLENQNVRETLSVFPKLTTLACNLFDYASDEEYDAMMETLRHIVRQKRILRRSDLKIYFQSVELNDIGKIDEFESAESDLTFQINNYNSLCENITFDGPVDYNQLMRLVKGKLPDDFFKKYFNISHVIVSAKVVNRDHLVHFLKTLKCLNTLQLDNIAMDQAFYDGLDQIGGLERLFLTNGSQSITKCDFLLNLKSLEIFSTDRILPSFFDSILELFKRSKYIRILNLYFTNGFIKMSSKRESNTFDFQCYEKTQHEGNKLLFEKLQLQFDQLVQEVDEFKIDLLKEE